MIEIILGILKGLLTKVATDEFVAGCPSFATWLVKKSAGTLPTEQERWAEQWLADLEDRRTPIRKVMFALGVWCAAFTMRRQPALDNTAQAIRMYLRFRRVMKEGQETLRSLEEIQFAPGEEDWEEEISSHRKAMEARMEEGRAMMPRLRRFAGRNFLALLTGVRSASDD